MKKGTSFFYTFISIICLALCSCNISLVDTDLMSKPEVDCSDNQVTISIHKINSGTDYINVYRKESDDEEVICGIIFPKDLSNKSTLYYFIDSLVKTNKKYQYKICICTT